MEIKLQCGDTIAIPDGCKAIVKDGSVVIEKEVQEFKDGDILAYVDDTEYPCPFIYKNTDKKGFHSYYVGLDIGNRLSICDKPSYHWGSGTLRYATEEEKQELFDKMKEQGLKWNAEEKRVENIRWRAEEGEEYFSIDTAMRVRNFFEDFKEYDDFFYDAFNYFKTKEQAEEAAKRIKEVLRIYHEEIGE